MEYIVPEPGDPLNRQVASACAETIDTVHASLRALQSAALDVQDAITALQRLRDDVGAGPERPTAGAALEQAIERGLALVALFDEVGLYSPVPLEFL